MSDYATRLRELREASGVAFDEIVNALTPTDDEEAATNTALAVMVAESGDLGPGLTMFGLVRLTEVLELDGFAARELVARRMAEQYGLGDDWEHFTRVAGLVIERYSDEEEV